MIVIYINDVEYSFEEPGYDYIIGSSKEECLLKALNNDKNLYKYLKDNYPIALDKVYNKIVEVSYNSLGNEFQSIVSNDRHGESMFKFGLGIYSLCKRGASLEDANQREFYFKSSYFIMKIITFIDAYVKSNSKKK